MVKTPVLTTTNSDTVSGTTILSDGTKTYWTEGRSSRVVVLSPEGKWSVHSVADENLYDDGVLSDDPGPVMRAATLAEEFEHSWAREQTQTNNNGQFYWLRTLQQEHPGDLLK